MKRRSGPGWWLSALATLKKRSLAVAVVLLALVWLQGGRSAAQTTPPTPQGQGNPAPPSDKQPQPAQPSTDKQPPQAQPTTNQNSGGSEATPDYREVNPPGVKTLKEDTGEYVAGSHKEIDLDKDGQVVQVRIVGPSGHVYKVTSYTYYYYAATQKMRLGYSTENQYSVDDKLRREQITEYGPNPGPPIVSLPGQRGVFAPEVKYTRDTQYDKKGHVTSDLKSWHTANGWEEQHWDAATNQWGAKTHRREERDTEKAETPTPEPPKTEPPKKGGETQLSPSPTLTQTDQEQGPTGIWPEIAPATVLIADEETNTNGAGSLPADPKPQGGTSGQQSGQSGTPQGQGTGGQSSGQSNQPTPQQGSQQQGQQPTQQQGSQQTQPQSQSQTPQQQPSTGTSQSSGQTQGTQQGSGAPPGVDVRIENDGSYGSGGHSETWVNMEGKTIRVRKLDPNNRVREDWRYEHDFLTNTDTTNAHLYNEKGQLDSMTIWTFDKDKRPIEFYQMHYDERGYWKTGRSTDYKYTKEGTREIRKDFKTGKTEETFIPNPAEQKTQTPPQPKTPETPKPEAPKAEPPKTDVETQVQPLPTTPQMENVGLLVARDYHPGDTISGSLWKADYAKLFDSVPGLSEHSFQIPVYHLPDGSPNWSSLEVGIPGYGETPVGPDGLFSVHIPMNWKGALQFQVREPDILTGNSTFSTNFEVGDPLASPTLPSNLFSAQSQSNIDYEAADYLVDLWNEAFDLEEEYDQIIDKGELYAGELWDTEDDLDDVYDEIDYAPDYLSTSVIVSMAKRMAKRNRDLNAELRTENLTEDQEKKLQQYDRWAKFLEEEADYFTEQAADYSHYPITPFWTLPAQFQDKLVALRGSYFGDPYNTRISIDGTSVDWYTRTSHVCYFMPTPGLAAGGHTYTIDTPGMPVTTLPFWYLTLTMRLADAHLHKGQKTTYEAELDGFLGAPNSMWGSPFVPYDLVSPSNLPNPLPKFGSIWFTLTNESEDVIKSKNLSFLLDAKSIALDGSFKTHNDIFAKEDGGFTIVGVASPLTTPELGFGTSPGSTTPTGTTPTSNNLFTNYGWNLSAASSSTPANLNCAGEGTAATAPGATGSSAATSSYNFNLPISHCMGSAAFDDYTQAMGGSSTVEIGGPPTQEERDAARKRVEEARQKVKDAYDRYDEKRKISSTAWGDALKNVPSDVQMQASYAYADKFAAELAYKKALDEYKTDPSAANNAKLQAASVANAKAIEAFDKAVKAEIDHFAPADRAAWEAAEKERKEAELDKIRANQELRDAHEAEDRLRPIPAWIKYSF